MPTTDQMTRMETLLILAADALDDGRDPFGRSFLVEHEVTLDECFDMADAIADAVRAWLRLNEVAR